MVKYPTARASALINTMELALGDTQSQDRTLVLGPLPIFESAIIPIALRMREYDLRAGASKARQQELEDYIREFNNFPVMPNTKKLEKSKDGFELVAIFDEDPGFKILANRMRPHAWAQNDCILFVTFQSIIWWKQWLMVTADRLLVDEKALLLAEGRCPRQTGKICC